MGPELLERARRIADEILLPAAEKVDSADRVPAPHLEALASAGLMSIASPGGPAPGAALLLPAVHEVLASGCGATSFVWAQHHSPLRLVAASPNTALRDRILGPMRTGAALAGIGFSHLRRAEPTLTAEPCSGGWQLSGRVPWLTSWGMAQVFLLGARVATGSVAWVVFRPDDSGRWSARPLPLSVLGATGTVELTLRRWRVPETELVNLENDQSWRWRDRLATAAPSAGALGVADRCVRMLADSPSRRATEAGASLGLQLDKLRASGLSLARRRDRLAAVEGATAGGDRAEGDSVGDGLEAVLAKLHRVRAKGLLLAHRAAAAVVVANGGRAMAAGHPAQRLAREAAFYLVQAQTAEGRDATLEAVSAF